MSEDDRKQSSPGGKVETSLPEEDEARRRFRRRMRAPLKRIEDGGRSKGKRISEESPEEDARSLGISGLYLFPPLIGRCILREPGTSFGRPVKMRFVDVISIWG